MNKKNITLVLAGFLLILFQFHVRIGSVVIDLFHDTAGCVLMLLGLIELVPRNKLFKKTRKFAFIGIVLSLFVQLLNTMEFGEYTPTAETIKVGITVFFFIYATYYFTEALILEAQSQNNLAVTRNFRLIWTVFGGSLFLHFLALMSGIGNLSMIVMIISYIAGLHYSYTILNACNALYTENMPQNIDNR